MNKVAVVPVTKEVTVVPMVELDENISVVLSTKVYAQIAYLLQKINTVEWSAILLYTTEGHITVPSKMQCTVDSLYVMDKGTASYTEHNYDNDDIVDMFNEFPEYMGMRMGHVHSHNTMGSFFSGTDIGELRNNAPNHVYYLSLIVNNVGQFIAKIAYMGKREVKSKMGIQTRTGKWSWTKTSTQVEEEVMFVHNCDITFQMSDGVKFVQRVDKVIKRSDAKVKVLPVSTYGNIGKAGFKTNAGYYKKDDPFQDYTGYQGFPTTKTPTYPTNYFKERSALARTILACDTSGIDIPLWTLTQKVENEMRGMDDDAITDSYVEFFTVASPDFIQEAFSLIYKDSDKVDDYDFMIIEIEAAIEYFTLRVGDCIREAVENVLVDWEISKQELEEAMAEAETTAGSVEFEDIPAYLSKFENKV